MHAAASVKLVKTRYVIWSISVCVVKNKKDECQQLLPNTPRDADMALQTPNQMLIFQKETIRLKCQNRFYYRVS